MARKKTPSPFVLSLVGHLFAGYLWLVRHTVRWKYVGQANHQALIDSGKGFILASWHGRFIMMPSVTRNHLNGSVALSSNHKDAEYMVAVFKQLGIEAVRGSTSNSNKPDKKKGGASGFRQLLAKVKAGKVAGLTPDGPRGPAYHAQLGTVQLSRLADVPILPMAFSTKCAKRFDGWDRFMLPLPIPFGTGYIVFGDAYTVTARGAPEMEDARSELELQINRVTARADQLAGVEPDPVNLRALNVAETSQ